MKMQKKVVAAIACTLGTVMSLGSLAGCKGPLPANKKALVIMSDELNELYNPFYSTAGSDMDVVGQTQVSMFTTDKDGNIAYGEKEPAVVLDYEEKPYNSATNTTEYYFVLKKDIRFSDGTPLTMNDVLFNMYVYLDPSYTGSTTMYSTDIVGLQTYRQQSNTTVEGQDDVLTSSANGRAQNRRNELIQVFQKAAGITASNPSGSADEETVLATIENNHVPSSGYMSAVGIDPEDPEAIADAKEQLKEDYNDTIAKFREELSTDYKNAKGAFTEEPYKSAPVFDSTGKQVRTGFGEIESFMYQEGRIELEYYQEAGKAPDKSKIVKANLKYSYDSINTEAAAINYIYRSNVYSAFDQILLYWATGTEMFTNFVAKAKDVILHEQMESDHLGYPRIEGIVSIGHHEKGTETVTINNKSYRVAQEHDEKGLPTEADAYDVLRITINGVDPKAIWNFGFSVAPYHYYSDPNAKSSTTQEMLNSKDEFTRNSWKKVTEIDIEDDNYGVAWASFDFQEDILQGANEWGESKNKVPFGAGPYIATDSRDSDISNLKSTEFVRDNIVYYKANHDFILGAPKIEHMQYAVTQAANALTSLESGQVHFVTPQFTIANADKIKAMESRGVGQVDSWQLGYGYIGVNAGEVKNMNLRKAIMSAMNTELALAYYSAGQAVTIGWPMSAVSWAYPRTGGGFDGANPTANRDDRNGKDYMTWEGDEEARKKIRSYTQAALNEGASKSDLRLDFVIAGSSVTDHPAYQVFKHAMDLLNSFTDLGWDITVKPDASALIKLSTGSLAVWAAAWGSTIDPDMYQVYHKNSTATSVLSWGYDDILASPTMYPNETRILNLLATQIDAGRKTTNQTDRAAIYRTAMGYVLDLAVEMPLYQRKTLYAYNTLVIDVNSMPHNEAGELEINPYTSPLARIWEIEFTK